MTQYLLNVIQPSEGPAPPPERLAAIMRDVDAVRDEMQAAGAWVFAAGLHPPSAATTLRHQGPDILTVDGPFIEGKEYIGGFSIVRAAHLDDALAWGRKLARATTLPVEVRPMRE